MSSELSVGGELAKAATELLNEMDPDTYLAGIEPLRLALENWSMAKPDAVFAMACRQFPRAAQTHACRSDCPCGQARSFGGYQTDEIKRSHPVPRMQGPTSITTMDARIAELEAVRAKAKPDARQEKMQQLALTNPIVRGYLDMQREPGVLYEDVLEMMVLTLVQQNEAALAELMRINQRGLPPVVIVTSQEQADQIRARYVREESPPKPVPPTKPVEPAIRRVVNEKVINADEAWPDKR